MEDILKEYPIHKIDKSGNLWIYWHGWYKVPDISNPLKIIEEMKKCHT